MKQVCISLDESIVTQLKAESQVLQIPLSATARLAILRGLNQLDDEKIEGILRRGCGR